MGRVTWAGVQECSGLGPSYVQRCFLHWTCFRATDRAKTESNHSWWNFVMVTHLRMKAAGWIACSYWCHNDANKQWFCWQTWISHRKQTYIYIYIRVYISHTHRYIYIYICISKSYKQGVLYNMYMVHYVSLRVSNYPEICDSGLLVLWKTVWNCNLSAKLTANNTGPITSSRYVWLISTW